MNNFESALKDAVQQRRGPAAPPSTRHIAPRAPTTLFAVQWQNDAAEDLTIDIQIVTSAASDIFYGFGEPSCAS